MHLPIGKRILEKAKELLKAEPQGIRYQNLVGRIQEAPNANIKTIQATVWNINKKFPQEIYKPGRGNKS